MRTFCLCLLALGGCFLSGYDERPLSPTPAPGEAGAPNDGGSLHDAGVGQPDLDAGSETDLDAGIDGMMDADLDGAADAADLSSIDAYCRTRPCGQTKQCDDPARCALSCGPLDIAYPDADAGRSEIDCTFDCNGAKECETSCGPSLQCQSACVGVDVCQTHCGVGADCDVYCFGSRCKGECESGSHCAFDCRNASCEEVVCRAGASCLLRCEGNGPNLQGPSGSSCKFAVCETGEPQRCGNGRTVVCGRPCPMMR